MPIRNPFKRAPGDVAIHDENQPPRSAADSGFQNIKVTGSNPVEIKEPMEFKLSEINDSGVYLPPSPTEKKSFWHSASRTSTTSSNHRSLLSENEPFNISRESFDSYRRSFDISARSPVPDRQSLDVRRTNFNGRPSFDQRPSVERNSFNVTREEGFEDVGLNDEPKPQAKKRGLFSRFGDSEVTTSASNENSRPSSSHHGFHFTGRKRGQSGKGEELRSMPKATSPTHGIEAR